MINPRLDKLTEPVAVVVIVVVVVVVSVVVILMMILLTTQEGEGKSAVIQRNPSLYILHVSTVFGKKNSC